MNQKVSAGLAWVLCAVVIAGSMFSVFLVWNDPQTHTNVFVLLNNVLSGLFPIAFGVVGALILSRRTRNRIGWLLMFIAVFMAVSGTLQSYFQQPFEHTPIFIFLIWLSGWGWWLLIGPLLLILLTFPTGHLLSPRWWWVVGMIGLLFILFLVLTTFAAEWQDPVTGEMFPNPWGLVLLPADFKFEEIGGPWIVALVSAVVACILSVGLRYRRSGAVEREQLKWFVFACAIFLAGYVVAGLAFINTNPPDWFGVLLTIAIAFIPISIGIAILRYRLFDIDVIIRRTVTYALVVALLAVVYFGSVILLQQLFANVTGLQENEIITVLSTLAIAALFVPLRNRVQNAIDKRFNRKKYDAQKIMEHFSRTVRDETDIDKLTNELVNVVQETMQPKSVSLWLKKETKK